MLVKILKDEKQRSNILEDPPFSLNQVSIPSVSRKKKTFID